MSETIQIVLAIVGMGVTILLTLVGVSWRLGGRLERIDRRMGEFGAGIRSLNSESTNPLTHDEVRRFRELVGKARLGELFSYEETEEYNKLIRKVQADHPDDPAVWPLVALGAFLSGLYPGRRPENSG